MMSVVFTYLTKKNILTLLGAFLLYPILGFSLLYLSELIPGNPIWQHTIESADKICECKTNKHKLISPDTFTDSIMLMEAGAKIEGYSPAKRILLNPFYTANPNGNWEPEQSLASYTANKTSELELFHYARYWHGYIVVLRPLLYFFSYEKIRLINFIILNLLALTSVYLLAKKINIVTACCFLSTLLIVKAPILPISLQYIDTFAISIIAVIIILLCPDSTKQSKLFHILFFSAVGATTAYIDFLTTPILTLALPLTVLLLQTKETNNSSLCIIGVCAFIWFAGYTYMWATKWILTSICTQENVIADAINQIMIRSAGLKNDSATPAEHTLGLQLRIFARNLYHSSLHSFLAIIFIASSVLFFIFNKKEETRKFAWLTVISLLPIGWFILALEHSLQHWSFTGRMIAAIIFPLAVFFSSTINWGRIRNLLANLLRNQ